MHHNSQVVPYEPVPCKQCGGVLNPYASVDYYAKVRSGETGCDWDVVVCKGYHPRTIWCRRCSRLLMRGQGASTRYRHRRVPGQLPVFDPCAPPPHAPSEGLRLAAAPPLLIPQCAGVDLPLLLHAQPLPDALPGAGHALDSSPAQRSS
jgi:RNase P subunit RPR2